MGHGIGRTDRFGEVRSNGLKAWHGLGQAIPDGSSAVDAFQLLGLDWPTELLPVYAERMTADGIARIEVPEHRLHVRGDTGDALGVVSHRYQSVENIAVAEFADAVCGADAAAITETAGSLHGGKRVFVLVRLPGEIRARGDDVSIPYLLASNGHGGTASFQVYPTTVRVVCRNTLAASSSDARRGLRFTHRGEPMEKRLAKARRILGTAQAELAKFQQAVTAMVSRGMTYAESKAFAEGAWAKAFGDVDGVVDVDDARAKLRAKRDEDVARILANLERDPARGTLYGALNAVTEFHDHQRGGNRVNRAASNLFGASDVDKRKALRMALAMV